jgi:hypothetical protein
MHKLRVNVGSGV